MPIYTLPIYQIQVEDNMSNIFPAANYGLLTSNNATDTNNDIDIAVGQALSDDNSTLIELMSALTKRLDAAWSQGTNQGMLDTGAKAALTCYALFLIYNPTTLNTDVLASLSFTAPTMPAGYTKKYLLGAILTNAGSNIIQYEQAANYFNLKEFFTLVSDGSITANTFETVTVPLPPKSTIGIMGSLDNSTGTDQNFVLYIRPVIEPSTISQILSYLRIDLSVTQDAITNWSSVYVGSTQQIKYASTESSGVANINITMSNFRIER